MGGHLSHHKYADRDGDPHSPAVNGFYYAHVGWFLNDARNDALPETNPVVRDFGSVPEIAWLERYYVVPPLMLAHATFAINTVNHLWGTRCSDTPDDWRNNALTAFFAAGEGWHKARPRVNGVVVSLPGSGG